MLSNPSSSTSLGILISFHGIAFLTTFFRLAHRLNTRRLWWDDFWAFIALLGDIFVWVVFMVVAISVKITPHGIVINLPSTLTAQLFFKFGTLLPYTTTLWAARASVAVTIVRLLNPGRFRTISKIATGIFAAFWFLLVVQKVFSCGTKWSEVPACPTPPSTGYVELATDIIGDLWLLLAPAYMLWRMKLNQRHYRLILAIFCCGIFTSASCIVHIYFILAKSPGWLGVTGHIQLGVSIVVCNLLVVVTYIYRVFWSDPNRDSEDSSEETSSKRSSSGQTNQSRNASNALSSRSGDTTTTTTAQSSDVTQITFTDIQSSQGESSYPGFASTGTCFSNSLPVCGSTQSGAGSNIRS